ncbi:hypothetical protein [Hydrogenophaga atypica]|uniref:Uncharacterized protein n=1 Tax=Hydrogenophaga atypica TaxID=249409 RepID=A0ABW2QTE5_9BURK
MLYRAGQWGLSPAFDIAPYHKPSGIHALRVTKSGERASSLSNLLECAVLLGVGKDEARDHLLSRQSMLAQRGPQVAESAGFLSKYCRTLRRRGGLLESPKCSGGLNRSRGGRSGYVGGVSLRR